MIFAAVITEFIEIIQISVTKHPEKSLLEVT
jgi:hypothetical protein